MGLIALQGIDLTDPTPSMRRELAPARGSAGGVVRARDIVILCNKLSTVGSGSVDGRGDALDQPIMIVEGEKEVIERFGARSEALLLYRTAVAHNKVTQIWICCVAPGATTATVDFTFATNASVNGVVRVSFIGESVDVAVLAGDTPTIVAANVSSAINAKYYFPLAASPAAGVLTVAASWAGARGTHYINKIRIAFVQTNAMTITKGSVTAGGTDDDQTNAILALENVNVYYQVNPKALTGAATSTDNGIGEHLAAVTDWISPVKGKQCVLIAAAVGTVSQATTTSASLNKWYANFSHAENSDWSPGMIASMMAAIIAKGENSDRAYNFAGYGGKPSDVIQIPAPFSPGDRPTATEIKTLLNNGVTPIAFTDAGKPYIVMCVTTQHTLSSQYDYRVRMWHIASVLFDFWETVKIEWQSIAQPKVADDPKQGEKPQVGFNYPKDARALLAMVVDIKIDLQPATLDPGQRQQMKDSIYAERLPSGTAAKIQIAAVRHNNQSHWLIEEVSPSI